MKTTAPVVVGVALAIALIFGGIYLLVSSRDHNRMTEAVQRVELACGPQKAHVFEQLWPNDDWARDAREASFEWAKNCQTRPQR